MRIRAATPADAEAIAAIYAPYVTDGFTSFEAEAPHADEMRRRIESGGGLYPWLTAESDGTLLGYAYASAFRQRPAYRYTVETSIYLSPHAHGQGIGRQLYGSLIDLLERQCFAQAIGAVTLPNPASVRLHEALGFRRAGTYEQVGYKLDAWRDVGLWQRALALASPPREPIRLADLSQSDLSDA